MARQVINLPSSAVRAGTGNLQIQPPQGTVGLIDTDLVSGGGVAYLRSIFMVLQDRIDVYLGDADTGLGSGAGPEFTDAMETDGAITIVAGTLTLVLSGLDDATEPYSWTPDNQADVDAFINGYVTGTDIVITLDDDVPIPPQVTIQTETQVLLGGQTINLEATATDPDGEESDLTSVWSGRGTFADRNSLNTQWAAPAGQPDTRLSTPLTLTVTDSDGLVGSAQVFMTIRALGLRLSDMPSGGLEFDALALLESASNPANIFSRPPRAEHGALLEGELEIGSTDEPITRIRILNNGTRFVINDSGPLNLSMYFGEGGDGHDLTVYVRTGTGDAAVASWTVADNTRALAGQNAQFNVPASEQSILTGIATGDRWVFALARGTPVPQGQVQASVRSGVPTVLARVRAALPAQIRAAIRSGVPVVSARVRATSSVRVQAAIRSGVPAVSARVRSRPPGKRIRASIESGVPFVSATVRRGLPARLASRLRSNSLWEWRTMALENATERGIKAALAGKTRQFEPPSWATRGTTGFLAKYIEFYRRGFDSRRP